MMLSSRASGTAQAENRRWWSVWHVEGLLVCWARRHAIHWTWYVGVCRLRHSMVVGMGMGMG